MGQHNTLYRERVMKSAMPKSRQSWNYGQLGHYGEPARDAERRGESHAALMYASANYAQRERTEMANANPKGWVSSAALWDIVRKILDANPTVSLYRAKEMAMLAE